MRRRGSLGVVLAALLFPVAASGSRAIPDDNLAYPILIQLEDSVGTLATGFLINDSTFTFLATARHTFFDDAGKLKSSSAVLTAYGSNPEDTRPFVIRLDLKSLLASRRLRKHASHDAAVIEFAKAPKKRQSSDKDGGEGPGTRSFVPGIQAIQAPDGMTIIGVSRSNIKLLKDVLVANDVFVFGYPASLGISNIPQFDYRRPLLRKGIVAGKSTARQSIVIDAPVYGGNSGGPVVELESEGFGSQVRAIGVISSFVPYATKQAESPPGAETQLANSGYAIVVPMDVILELIDQRPR